MNGYNTFPWTKSSTEIVLDATHVNGEWPTEDHVLDSAVVSTITTPGSGPSSMLVLTRRDGVLEGRKTFGLNRLPLDKVFNNQVPITGPVFSSLYAALPWLSTRFGIKLAELDVVDRAFDTGSVLIAATPYSPGFTGTGTLKYNAVTNSLPLLITQRDVQGPDWGPEVKLGRSLILAMYRADFSADLHLLTISGGSWTQPDAVKQIMLDSGFTDWPTTGTVEDLPTSAVAYANPAFARVIRQDPVTVAGYTGPALFHYNLIEVTPT